jgi:hypothetical protein
VKSPICANSGFPVFAIAPVKTQAPDRQQLALFLPDCSRANDKRSGRGKSAYPPDICCLEAAGVTGMGYGHGSQALLAYRHCLMDLVQIPMPLSNA